MFFELEAINNPTKDTEYLPHIINFNKIVAMWPKKLEDGKEIGTFVILEGNSIPILLKAEYQEMKELFQQIMRGAKQTNSSGGILVPR